MRAIVLAVSLFAVVGCTKKPTAADVCQKLVESGVASNCRASQPAAMSAQAAERFEFDLPSVAGKTGQVLRFDSEEKFTATEGAFEKAAALAGPHRYGSKKALIFVQANNGLSAAEGSKAKAVVDAL